MTRNVTETQPLEPASQGFFEELREQRWDDHRLYHHSRINQSLHLLSALSFLTAYAMLAIEPSIAVLVGWVVAMWSRQIGHFFFEPKGFDDVNELTHERKEEIKVGYNLRRIAQTPATFTNWSELLSGLVREKVGGSPAELTFHTRSGQSITSPNVVTTGTRRDCTSRTACAIRHRFHSSRRASLALAR